MTIGDRLPRSARLNDDQRIESFRSTARFRGRWFMVRPRSNDLGYARLAIRIAKRVERTAVARNRLKRCVREVFRRKQRELSRFDYLVTVVGRYAEPSLDAARRELEHLFVKHQEER